MSIRDTAEGVEARRMGAATADELYASVETMLEEGLYEPDDSERAQATLRSARILTQDPEMQQRIDALMQYAAERSGEGDDDRDQ
jgi:hypothetical protein